MAQNVILDNKSLETIDITSQLSSLQSKIKDTFIVDYNRDGPYWTKIATTNVTNMTWGERIIQIYLSSTWYQNVGCMGIVQIGLNHHSATTDNNVAISIKWIYPTDTKRDCIRVVKNLDTGIVDIYLENKIWDSGIYGMVLFNSGWSLLSKNFSFAGWVNEPTTSGNIIVTNSITNSLIDIIYPVGAVYISTASTSPQTLFGGSWESIGTGRCLMGVDGSHAAGTTAEAGLPNISGNFPASLEGGGTFATSGAFALAGKGYFGWGVTGTDYDNYGLNFDASRCSAIYGKSSTVQPPAYYVYMWRRIG